MSTRDDDVTWLCDCGWCGWLEDLHTGKVTTHRGDTFDNVGKLRSWLESLPSWPEAWAGARNIPKRRATAPSPRR